jgi:Galactose oxidase, central domain/Kelch motif
MYIYGGFALECLDACSDMWRFEIAWASQTYYPSPSEGFWNRGGYWEKINSTYSPGARMKHNLVVSPDYEFMYLFGGLGNNTLYNDIWKYSTYTNTWEILNMYGIEIVTRNVSTWNGEVYEVLIDINEKRINDTIVYSDIGSMPQPRMSSCLLYFNGTDYLFLFGGLGVRERLFNLGVTSVALNDFWVYSLSSFRWTEIFSDTNGPSARFDSNIMVRYSTATGRSKISYIRRKVQ